MAKNTGNRIPVKWIRDRAKSAYDKQSTCYICGTDQDLELHHTHSITLLLERWIEKTGRDFSSDEAVLANRDEFIENHRDEIYKAVYTLCNRHHVALHSIYGKAPALHTAQKQGNWVETQKAKATLNPGDKPKVFGGSFSDFY
jgi:5-methylcytosine-specific restriction endonuclease McrA